jgi:hypothetical protein
MILITRSMDTASLTELPPNFMTIIGSPERKNLKNPNLHNYTFNSKASRQDHFEKAVWDVQADEPAIWNGNRNFGGVSENLARTIEK